MVLELHDTCGRSLSLQSEDAYGAFFHIWTFTVWKCKAADWYSGINLHC